MNNEVMSFIGRFTDNGENKGVIDTFTNGCCYWFAEVLKARFKESAPKVMYCQVDNHFGCEINGIVYDVTGDVTRKYSWEEWEFLQKKDELLYGRINRDCVAF